jgi:hypothetical protein
MPAAVRMERSAANWRSGKRAPAANTSESAPGLPSRWWLHGQIWGRGHADGSLMLDRVLMHELRNLIVRSARQDVPSSYETWRFIIIFTRTRQWSLFWISLIQSINHLFLGSILILSYYLRPCLPSGLLPYGRVSQTLGPWGGGVTCLEGASCLYEGHIFWTKYRRKVKYIFW